GTAMVYLGESISLCALEVLVHLQATGPLDAYSLIRVDYESSHIEDVDLAVLPAQWTESPPPPEVQQLGDDWVVKSSCLLLRVPSAIIPNESNVLLNPNHPAFSELKLSPPTPFRFDSRLFK
ncbi:MAG: RES family NAD+ phosphorylase, partial [Byssovorax sp.]